MGSKPPAGHGRRPDAFRRMTPDEARTIAQRNSWTQRQVAEGLGVSLRGVQRWFTVVEYLPGPVAVALRIWDEFPATRPPALTTQMPEDFDLLN